MSKKLKTHNTPNFTTFKEFLSNVERQRIKVNINYLQAQRQFEKSCVDNLNSQYLLFFSFFLL